MQNEHAAYPARAASLQTRAPQSSYDEAEESFASLMATARLDEHVRSRPRSVVLFERARELTGLYETVQRSDGNQATIALFRRFIPEII